ncbi:ankyrin repeat domain-containing protein [Noviherbaspirillum sp. DKR-6]|uniref:Ankyrin repeat domain-containing protein n=1 Tax=Noviherbaspirillum pedocola TaxID=2801341 RepID=A0A934SRX6_9BURK|nr:ankyrin repeat domain-containing protein [Noviherbaspirillum pedocola]
MVQRLLKEGARVNQVDADHGTALIVACQNGHLAIVQALLRSGAQVDKVNAHGTNALIIAAREGHADIVRALHQALKQARATPSQANVEAPQSPSGE